MNGSARLASHTAEAVRLPYATPQAAPPSRSQDAAAAGARPLVPFVPREFRALVKRDFVTTPTPTPELVAVAQLTESSAVARLAEPSVVARLAEPSVVDRLAEPSVVEEDSPADGGPELPWIDAFARDGEEAEETWPMGEAGKRLDELTDSLSSLDASRARGASIDETSAPQSGHAMWNEDEWIDIMPPSAAASEAAESTPESAHVPEAVAASKFGAELAALALESLARRVRAGQVQIPAMQPELAEEAVLAGILASMLGYRQ